MDISLLEELRREEEKAQEIVVSRVAPYDQVIDSERFLSGESAVESVHEVAFTDIQWQKVQEMSEIPNSHERNILHAIRSATQDHLSRAEALIPWLALRWTKATQELEYACWGISLFLVIRLYQRCVVANNQQRIPTWYKHAQRALLSAEDEAVWRNVDTARVLLCVAAEVHSLAPLPSQTVITLTKGVTQLKLSASSEARQLAAFWMALMLEWLDLARKRALHLPSLRPLDWAPVMFLHFTQLLESVLLLVEGRFSLAWRVLKCLRASYAPIAPSAAHSQTKLTKTSLLSAYAGILPDNAPKTTEQLKTTLREEGAPLVFIEFSLRARAAKSLLSAIAKAGALRKHCQEAYRTLYMAFHSLNVLLDEEAEFDHLERQMRLEAMVAANSVCMASNDEVSSAETSWEKEGQKMDAKTQIFDRISSPLSQALHHLPELLSEANVQESVENTCLEKLGAESIYREEEDQSLSDCLNLRISRPMEMRKRNKRRWWSKLKMAVWAPCSSLVRTLRHLLIQSLNSWRCQTLMNRISPKKCQF